jgi:hypothetical protein
MVLDGIEEIRDIVAHYSHVGGLCSTKHLPLKGGFEKAFVTLYANILEYKNRIAYYLARNKAGRIPRAMAAPTTGRTQHSFRPERPRQLLCRWLVATAKYPLAGL